jgi:rare lipoprotein A
MIRAPRFLLSLVSFALACTSWAAAPHGRDHPARDPKKPQVGKASIYSKRFAGKRMANGERMDPRSNNAASKTLPLGTRARVTNLETGRSAIVRIEDRGPHVPGRVVDLSPATAEQIGLTRRHGLARVEVQAVELPDEATVAGQ